ncbi:hypothetical protein M3Y94_00902100 [Aphelenchoides besseyi]|nr:hypothetical protein M3Y94_00902100 [Aphelenchoides besseyi]KAI6223342.1 hypothetical protein M3Y95_00880000 [Aphelenchoides besseyi]
MNPNQQMTSDSHERREKEAEIAKEAERMEAAYAFTRRPGIDVHDSNIVILNAHRRACEVIRLARGVDQPVNVDFPIFNPSSIYFKTFERQMNPSLTNPIDEFCMKRWKLKQQREAALKAPKTEEQQDQ